MSDDLHPSVEALQKEVEYWQGVAWGAETSDDLQKRLVAFTTENRHLNRDNCDMRLRIRELEKEVAYWQDVARSARGVTRTYMKVGENLINERVVLEKEIDNLREQVDNLGSEYRVHISEDLKGEKE